LSAIAVLFAEVSARLQKGKISTTSVNALPQGLRKALALEMNTFFSS
jgi:hypothetical protein